jgi:hypothetical protein
MMTTTTTISIPIKETARAFKMTPSRNDWGDHQEETSDFGSGDGGSACVAGDAPAPVPQKVVVAVTRMRAIPSNDPAFLILIQGAIVGRSGLVGT